MKPEHVETLAALFDGERVDPVLLAEALKDPEAAAMLDDFASLRLLAKADADRPDDEFYAAMAPVLRGRPWRDWWTSAARPAIAASLLLLAAATGYWVRQGQERLPQLAPQRRIAAPAGSPPRGTTAGPERAATAAGTAAALGPVVPEAPPPSALNMRMSEWHATGPTRQPNR
jgi:hypothetical protein